MSAPKVQPDKTKLKASLKIKLARTERKLTPDEEKDLKNLMSKRNEDVVVYCGKCEENVGENGATVAVEDAEEWTRNKDKLVFREELVRRSILTRDNDWILNIFQV